ncbi:sensor histidine kinase [Arachidicoccus terrestris]|uniref:sensor histidine kinase n=1 Tax=Arachidicoccus terrestris TaxID=2875539 RepID=UPI001CC3917A|nr:histidine kinase [Arachidicoccus terrestris]UAY56707.1 histidine kinase [Arachidicoccus terrestris]
MYIFFALALVIILGWLQFEAQEWKINSDPYTTVAVKPNSVKAVRLQQPGGAIIYAMLKEAVYLLLGLGYAYMLDSIKKDKKAKALENANMQAELKILRYQINPHFLFNTINNIYYLALIQSEKTADALLQLSKILRYILNEKEATVSLGQEVEYLEQYIQLQLFRFPEGCIRKNISLDYKIRQRTIAPLLLITFVENAFKHGVSDRADTPILISLSNENGSLYYEVVNQIGDKLSKDSTMGIGLANLKRRLELLYPSSHHLELMEKEGHFIAKLHLSSL